MPNHAIVYLDDNPTERASMEAQLRATWDNPVLSFATGEALKAFLETTPVEDWPHVLFLDLDIQGQDMTGYEVVRWLRDTYGAKHTPVTVVVTGDPEKDAMLKAREAGARYYVVRPATQESLFAIIRRERSLANVLMRASHVTA